MRGTAQGTPIAATSFPPVIIRLVIIVSVSFYFFVSCESGKLPSREYRGCFLE